MIDKGLYKLFNCKLLCFPKEVMSYGYHVVTTCYPTLWYQNKYEPHYTPRSVRAGQVGAVLGLFMLAGLGYARAASKRRAAGQLRDELQ